MAQERPNAVTFKGNPLTLIGPEIKTGDKAPELVKEVTHHPNYDAALAAAKKTAA